MPEPLIAIDCDVHPALAGTRQLLPYLDEYWRDTLIDREVLSLESNSYPPNAPLTARVDWRGEGGRAAANVGELQAKALDRWGTSLAICNCLWGVQLVMNEDMAIVLARAVNDWIVKEWLDRDPRLRASIVVPILNVEHAVDEIARCAEDPRFVQVLLLAMGEAPLGRRQYWPIYAACERLGLTIGIHAGSAYRHPVTSLGWPTYYIEDYAAQSQGFQSQVSSLVCQGVFTKFPGLKVALLESGVTWMPGLMWRLSKGWRALRMEVPWLDRAPADIIRDHVRLTVQPLDAPPEIVERAVGHLRSDDMLLFASDFPHWQFDGDAVMPAGIPQALHRKICVDNPLATYPRLAAPLN